MPISQSGFGVAKEIAVARRARGAGWWVTFALIWYIAVVAGFISMVALHPAHGGGKAIVLIYGFPGFAPFVALYLIFYYQEISAFKKVLGFNPTKQNRAEGIIYWFYELRITKTELIKGYAKDAPRIPLRGLTATVKNTGAKTDNDGDRRVVDITIEGPDTNFVYSIATNSVLSSFFTITDAREFAAVLNYEASRIGAP